ncbi:2,3-bisphosphoglycerate-independent phosphoglycerate mutase [Apibacter adventoris]|uniref:2,3-bisphosphoglycerate-independent phosphoglycerate mutase n=1 Tax=Apibacter adventoris TaxID=1679466 RepID=A0A2S8AF50_9FLAO|nr:2,3-bisphosphoglycerate-independent phosphoglycerate mutase [Apibacter adventoris]PQL94273.1 2,3-bisphosphoglycerate-independent phosphoglycerate mutase [Apibacter adventoris]
MNKKVILMILDGWGIATDKKVSAIDQAKTPFIDSCFQKYSNTTLITYGLDVGLPKGQMGNSEVGHMNLGAGRVVYQNLAKINLAVENGTLGNEEELKKAFEYAKKNNKPVHFIGLVSDGGVHSHISHLKSLVEAANTSQVKNIFVHAFTDGRDCDPQSGKGFIKETLQFCKENNAKLASIVGRYYAMDRDKRWERVKIAYDTIVNAEGIKTSDPLNAIQKSYEDGITDEFLMPIIVTENDKPIATIQEGDVVICFNFRTDRPREIVEVLTQNDYPEQSMKKLDLYFVTMTEYDENFKNIRVIFKEDTIKNTLGEVIANATKKQIRIAETEKYPHVTFFFSGGKEEEFKNESRILCPSPKDVPTYDLKPQMAAYDIKNAIIPELKKKEVDFVCLNFANADMVGHTGVFEAAVKACEAVDECAKEICQTALENGYVTVIIADHGNSDKMKNEDGSPNTQHTTNLVPMIIVDNQQYKLHQGKLGDIAPTILTLMGIPIPKEMTGDVLI